MRITAIANCNACRDGMVFSPNGVFLKCSICYGTGMLTPHNICYCGHSCNTIAEDFATCGDVKCLEGLKRMKNMSGYNPFGSHSHF